MTDTNVSNYSLPSSPEDRKKIKAVLQDIAAQYQMIDDRRSFIKDALDGLHDTYKIPKKLSAKLAKTLYNHNYDKVSEETELFKLFYEEVVDKVNVTPTLSNLDTDD